MVRLVSIAAVAAALLVIACSASSGPSSGCSGTTACANGAGTMQVCYTRDTTGACASLYYQVGSTVYNCVSCDDQGYCANAALIACGVPDASIPTDADFPEGAVLPAESGSDAGPRDAAQGG